MARVDLLQRFGRRFDSCRSDHTYVNVAQLVRALPCQGRGRGFEFRHSLHFTIPAFLVIMVAFVLGKDEDRVRSPEEARFGEHMAKRVDKQSSGSSVRHQQRCCLLHCERKNIQHLMPV